MLSGFACFPEKTKGRLYPETPGIVSNFALDRHKIINSNAFRRLEYKTQVFVNYEGDHYRTRLTHSMEVANIARIICEKLGLCGDLSECIALAHDIGHPPFGHAGEDALQECMKDYGGFCHNSYAIKLLTLLEDRYAKYPGLNLSWEVLEGIAKHNGPIKNNISQTISNYNNIHNLELDKYSSLEAQVASLADDIAYHSHDIEDGIRSKMIDIQDFMDISLIREFCTSVESLGAYAGSPTFIYEIIRKFSDYLINDLVENTKKNIKNNNIKTLEDIRGLSKPLATFSEKATGYNKQIKERLYNKLYRNNKITIMRIKAQKVIKDLFNFYWQYPESLPSNWQKRFSDSSKAMVIADYIAGMTDRYAMQEFHSFFNLSLIKHF